MKGEEEQPYWKFLILLSKVLIHVGCTLQVFILAALAVAAFASLHHEPIHHPQPFKFGYSIKDKHGEQHREEVGDGKNVKGSYGFTDARGIKRQVNYVADHAGFRAEVKTNEPGTANQNPAAVHILSDAPYGHGGYAGAAGLGYAGVGGAGYGYGGLGTAGLGYGYGGLGAAGVGYGNAGLGVYGGYGLGNGQFNGLGYARYGF
ncbi:adult-specific cuticular protein ACP-20-like [Argiope bruennichi]|uniref:adult-specific cuticular protein ACP-20-like n=1 Tax=Argiope bruennichi TaxID=94029 RepID=UPI002493EF63|nr:adult-specific cuticular protein ACP-20-like [Argiope bruennichi]